MRLNDIKEKRSALVTEMRGILANAGDKLSTEQQTKFDSLKAEVTDLEGQEARANFLEAEERRLLGNVPNSESRDKAQLEGNVSISRILQAKMEGRSLTGAEAEYAQEAERRNGRAAEGVFVPLSLFEKRGTVNTTTTGNDLVGTDLRADQYVGALRNNLLARKLGVRVLSGLQGNVTIPRHTTGVSAGCVRMTGQ